MLYKRLLPKEAFAEIFEPLRNKRVALFDGIGNAGDDLIYGASRFLLSEFKIEWTPNSMSDAETVLLFGGGNMGPLHPKVSQKRLEIAKKAKRLGKEVIVLPQSATGPERGPYDKVFIRERASLRFIPNGILAPDMLLGLEIEAKSASTIWETGLFLRKDKEATFTHPLSLGDPTSQTENWLEYLCLASGFKHVITNRLHFAIAAMMAGRKTTLLPNSYHKNRSIWETWLKDLGCLWADAV